MADSTIFIALGTPDKCLGKTALIRSTLPTGSFKTSFDLLTRSLSLHCKQTNKIKNELDVSNYKATFSPVHLVFLELDTDRLHLDFKILDENNNEVIPRTFYLQLLNKQWVYTTLFNKEWEYWIIHNTKNNMIYPLKFMEQLLLTVVRSNLHKNI